MQIRKYHKIIITCFFFVPGNLITVIALLKYARLRKHATTAFVISLSISDLIFAAVNLPLTACRYLFEAWLLGDALCQIFPLFFYGNVAVSLLSMVAITLNRWVTILFSFRFIYRLRTAVELKKVSSCIIVKTVRCFFD